MTNEKKTEPLVKPTPPTTPPRPRSAVEIASDSAMEKFADLIKSGKGKLTPSDLLRIGSS
jgi:hypothetical protein